MFRVVVGVHRSGGFAARHSDIVVDLTKSCELQRDKIGLLFRTRSCIFGTREFHVNPVQGGWAGDQ